MKTKLEKFEEKANDFANSMEDFEKKLDEFSKANPTKHKIIIWIVALIIAAIIIALRS